MSDVAIWERPLRLASLTEMDEVMLGFRNDAVSSCSAALMSVFVRSHIIQNQRVQRVKLAACSRSGVLSPLFTKHHCVGCRTRTVQNILGLRAVRSDCSGLFGAIISLLAVVEPFLEH